MTNKRSVAQSTYRSHKIYTSNGKESGLHTKSKDVRFDTNTTIHIYRYGISNSAEYSQSSSGSSKSSYSDHQNNPFSDSGFGTNFPFYFGQTQCSSKLNSSRQIAFTTSARPRNVPVIGLETSYSSSRSSGYDQQYDQIPFKMVDEHQSFLSRDAHSPSRPQNFPLYGCQSLRLGGSSRTDESILSWSLVRRPITAPYQHVRNNGHWLCTDKSLEINSLFLCHDSYRQHNSGLIKQGGTHSPNLCIEVWQILHWCLKHQIIIRVRHIPGKFNVLADRLSRIDKIVKTEWALDQSIANSIFKMFNYPNLALFATRFNHKLPLYVSPVLDNQAFAIDAFFMNWNYLHAYTFPPTIMISSLLDKIRQSQCRIFLIAPLWPQQTWFSEVLHLLVSAPVRLPLFPNLLTQAKGKFQHQNLPALNFHAWELSNNQLEIKKFRKTLQILSPNQDEHQLRKSMMRNGSFMPVGVIEGRLIRSRPLLL